MSAAAGRRTCLAAFGVAFGILEAAVVVYLRELYYPEGFRFPLVIMAHNIAVVELVREFATLVMLAAVAVATGHDRMDRFFVFAFLFGVWDIVYYVGLRLFLGWPPSLLTWDVLFLIPVPWLGPVIYPVIVSLFLVAGFLVHEGMRAGGLSVRLRPAEWAVAAVGAVTIVVAFCWNWRLVLQEAVPVAFPAWMFTAGMVASVLPFVRAGLRGRREQSGRSATRLTAR